MCLDISMEQQDTEKERSSAEMMEIELRPWRPRIPKISIWLYTKPYGFHISALYYATLGLLMIGLGVLLSLLLGNGVWLSRFGSLVIVAGILFGVHGVEGKIDSDIRYYNEILKAIEKDEFEEKMRNYNGSFEKRPEHIADIVVHSVTQVFSGKREEDWGNRIKRNTLRIDAGIAIVGTLIWGFGDLVV